jgi:hypothetical protein
LELADRVDELHLPKVRRVEQVSSAHLKSAAAAAVTVTNMQPQRLQEPASAVLTLCLVVAAAVVDPEALATTLLKLVALVALLQVAAWCSRGILTPEPQASPVVMHSQETWQVAVQVVQGLNLAELLLFLDPQLFTQKVVLTGLGKMAQILRGHLLMDLVAQLTSPTRYLKPQQTLVALVRPAL